MAFQWHSFPIIIIKRNYIFGHSSSLTNFRFYIYVCTHIKIYYILHYTTEYVIYLTCKKFKKRHHHHHTYARNDSLKYLILIPNRSVAARQPPAATWRSIPVHVV